MEQSRPLSMEFQKPLPSFQPSSDLVPLSILDVSIPAKQRGGQRPSQRLSHRPKSTPQPKLDEQTIRIITTYSTLSSRELSFKSWPHTNITPQQLARFGFYHHPYDGQYDTVRCFACASEITQWDPTGPYTSEELLELHEEDCMWAQMRREMQICYKDSTAQTETPPPAKSIQHHPDPQVDARPTQKSKADSQPSKPRTPLQAQSLPTTTPTIAGTTAAAKPTYASVLKSSPRSLPESKPSSSPITPRSSSPCPSNSSTLQSHSNSPKRILSVDDLRKRFHNRPSPLKSSRFDIPDTNNQHQKLAITATESLSNFLLSALPAFTKFLMDIHGNHSCDTGYNRFAVRT